MRFRNILWRGRFVKAVYLLLFIFAAVWIYSKIYRYAYFDGPDFLSRGSSYLKDCKQICEDDFKESRKDLLVLSNLDQIFEKKGLFDGGGPSAATFQSQDLRKRVEEIYDDELHQSCRAAIQNCEALGEILETKEALHSMFNLNDPLSKSSRTLLGAALVLAHHARAAIRKDDFPAAWEDVLLLVKTEKILASKLFSSLLHQAALVFQLKTSLLAEIRQNCALTDERRAQIELIYNSSLHDLMYATIGTLSKEAILLHAALIHAANLHVLPFVLPEYSHSPSKPLPRTEILFSSFDDKTPRDASILGALPALMRFMEAKNALEMINAFEQCYLWRLRSFVDAEIFLTRLSQPIDLRGLKQGSFLEIYFAVLRIRLDAIKECLAEPEFRVKDEKCHERCCFCMR